MKKILIIGAGVSGLSAGIFARKSGFEAEVFEMHSLPGGECTGWNRKGYHFDNCIHWLTGTNNETGLYQVWKELGVFDGTEVHHSECFYAYSKKGKTLYMYRDLERLEKHLLDLSPEDQSQINSLITLIKKFQVLNMPTAKPMHMMNIIDYIKLGRQYSSLSKDMSFLNELSVEEYGKRFKSSLIAESFSGACPKNFSAMALIVTLGSFTSGNGGWPMGGSLKMSQRIADKLESLGGKINYNTKVKRIVVENGRALGIELEDGRFIEGDYVISAADANVLMNNLLEGKFSDEVFDKQFNNPDVYITHSSVDISIGVACDLSHREHQISYEVEPFQCGPKTIGRIGIRHYCHEAGFAPEGCSVIKVRIMGDDYEYWKNLRQCNIKEYNEQKDKLAKDVMDRIARLYPETENKFEVFDVSTPVTYERYCGAYRGAWMGFDFLPKVKTLRHKGIFKGIDNLYVAGQWIATPGGLPVASLAGKWAIQMICRKEKVKFPFNY